MKVISNIYKAYKLVSPRISNSKSVDFECKVRENNVGRGGNNLLLG